MRWLLANKEKTWKFRSEVHGSFGPVLSTSWGWIEMKVSEGGILAGLWESQLKAKEREPHRHSRSTDGGVPWAVRLL